MRKTRAEILAELERRFGQSENTEHLLDWLKDLWETRDFLLKRFGEEYTVMIVDAVECRSFDLKLHDFVLCTPLEERDRSLLN